MSARRRDPHPPISELPTLLRLMAKARSDSRRDYCGARSASLKQAGAGGIPGEWEAQIIQSQEKRRRGGHNRRGLASLPVATAAEIAEADRRCIECGLAMPPDCRSDAIRCGEACKKAAKRKRAKQ